ncbi:hypothetical protein B0H14DRAFT_3432031 [Mycena olivaceomarginata]|nr:hypothetical protein B0H14DRAFT_3432031 [Mycena olivaceomarginata]
MSTTSSRAADRAYIAKIDSQISFLKESIQVLEGKKLRAQERLNSYAYPVLTVPNEIVSEIFVQFLPVYPSPPPMSGPLSPTSLSHICRRWRQVALSTPTLWRAVSLPDCDQYIIYNMSTKSSRAADRAYIAEIDSQILVLKESIRILEGKKLRARERLNSYAYPVLTLPNEIVSEIFVQFLPVYPSPPPMSGPLSPTSLSHICRRWRQVALSTPTLWRAVSLPDCAQYVVRPQLELWMSRSGCLPLSIDMEEVWNNVDESCLELLALHRARWEYVTLAVYKESEVLTIQDPMPLLRQFEIRIEISRPGLPEIRFCEVPRLRSVTLWGSTRPTDLLPWSQLTSLTSMNNTPVENTAILQLTVNLVHCHLMLWSEEILPSDVRLPSLESLVLASWDSEDEPVTHYLETMITPSLRTLEVPEAFLQPSPIDTLRLFISKSECRLQGLCITGKVRSEAVYRDAFSSSIPELSFDTALIDYNTYSECV